MAEKEREPPLTDEELRWFRKDKQKSEAYGIVWTAIKNIGGAVLFLIAAYYAIAEFVVRVIKKAVQ